MASFPNFNSGLMFGDAWAPGAAGFNTALKYWQGLLKSNGAGTGLPALAASAAASPVGQQYQATPYDPSADAGLAAYAQLKQGETGAREQGYNEQDQNEQAAIQGSTNVANAYGQSLTSHLQGMMAQNEAESEAAATGVGGALGLGNLGNSILGALFDPGNVSGAFGKATGPGAFLSPGSPGNAFGLPGTSGMMPGSSGGGSAPSTGNSSTYPGYTSVSPTDAASLASDSEESWLDPSTISQIGPSAAGSTGLASFLGSLFAW